MPKYSCADCVRDVEQNENVCTALRNKNVPACWSLWTSYRTPEKYILQFDTIHEVAGTQKLKHIWSTSAQQSRVTQYQRRGDI